jgi:NAD(P)H-dependent FMN reductase
VARITLNKGIEMKTVVVSGSHRKDSQSERVARYAADRLRLLQVDAEVVSLGKNPLPLWDEGVWSDDAKWKQSWGPISDSLKASSALVLVVPEWAGMVPPALKNFLLLCSSQEVGHKPVLLVSVSSGVGGSYPIAELRMSSYKNNRLVYIPDHVIIRDVESMLDGGDPKSDRDQNIRSRLDYSMKLLLEYAKALNYVRQSGVVDHNEFPYGL